MTQDPNGPASWHPDRIAAATMYGEARGEPPEGQAAVAWVIRNRAENPRWWGHDVASVCLKPFQFSCWNRNDPNRPKLLAVSTDALIPFIRIFKEVQAADPATDPTGGADSYIVTTLKDRTWWARELQPTVVIGHHSFYHVELKPRT